MIPTSMDAVLPQPSSGEVIPKISNASNSTDGSFQGDKILGRMLSEKISTQGKVQHNQVENNTRYSINPLRKPQGYYMRGSQASNSSKDNSLASIQSNQNTQRFSEGNLQSQSQVIKNLHSKDGSDFTINRHMTNSSTTAFWKQSPCKSLESNTVTPAMTFQSLNNLHSAILASQTPKDTPMSSRKNLPAFGAAKSTNIINQPSMVSRKTLLFPENEITPKKIIKNPQHNQPIIKKFLQTSSFQVQLQQQQQQQQKSQQYPFSSSSSSHPFLHAPASKTTYSRDKWGSLNSHEFSTFHPSNASQNSLSSVPFPQSNPLNSTQELPSIHNLANIDKLNHTTPYFRQPHSSCEIPHKVTLNESEMKLGMDTSDFTRSPQQHIRQPSIYHATTWYKSEKRKNNMNSASSTDMNIRQQQADEQQFFPSRSATDMNSTKRISQFTHTLYQRFLANLPGVEVRSWQTRLEEQLKQSKTPKNCLLTQVFDNELVNISDLNTPSQGCSSQNLNKYTSNIHGSGGGDGDKALRFPASQQELQQFSAALNENELKFARKKDPHGFQEDLMHRKTSSKLRGQDHKIHESLSLKIEAKLRERNSIIEKQNALQRKLTLETEMRQTVQIDALIKEQQQWGQGKQWNQEQQEHGRMAEQKVILRSSSVETNLHDEGEQYPTKGSNRDPPSRFDVENDLAKETHLVDFLQQKKRKVREVLERYLQSRPHFVKSLTRSCLMDADEFVFFIMSFYQYCVEDMFARFKANNTCRLAAIASKKQTFITSAMINCNTSSNNPAKQTIKDLFAEKSLESATASVEIGVSVREFNFGQKIPEEIMKIVFNVITHALSGTEKELRIEEHMQRSSLTGQKAQKIAANTNNSINRRTLRKGKITMEKTELVKGFGIVQQPNNQADTHDGITTNRDPDYTPSKDFLHEIEDKDEGTPNKRMHDDKFNQNFSTYAPTECFISLNDKLSWLDTNVQSQFLPVMQWNIRKQILPATIIEQIGGFVRVRQLIVSGVKSINNYINTSSKMNLLDEDDQELLDKHLMACICGLLSNDKETVNKEISIWKERGNQMSFYDFYTVKKIAWEITGGINLDARLRFYIIMQIENLRYSIFSHPFSSTMGNLPQSLMNSYQLANYFRNPKNVAETGVFFDMLFPVIYNNQPYEQFFNVISSKLKFQLNDRFFDHLLQFLAEQLKETDSKSVLDLELRIMKLRIKAGVRQNLFSVIYQNAEKFFEDLLPFLQNWVQKYTLSNTLMEAKAMDFTFLEVFIKQALNIKDLYVVLDTEPALLHFVINQSMLVFWIKGIVAYFEEKGIAKGAYKPLIIFITQCLLFRKEIEEHSESQQQSSKNIEDGTVKGQKLHKNE